MPGRILADVDARATRRERRCSGGSDRARLHGVAKGTGRSARAVDGAGDGRSGNPIPDARAIRPSGNFVWNLCGVLAVTYGSHAIFDALLTDDELAASMTRLAYWCDPRPLPD